VKVSRKSWLLRALLVACLALQAACSTGSSHSRQKQQTGGLAGHGNLMLAAMRATSLAAIRQPVTTTKHGLAILWHRPREIISGNLPRLTSSKPALAQAAGTPEFEALLDRKHFPRAESGSLKWLVDGNRFFPELDRQIAAANKSIFLQVYIFDNDDIAVRYADILKRRSADVSVRVLFDDIGSASAYSSAPATLGPRGFVPSVNMHAYLKDHSKVHSRRILTPWLAADHTKLFVFDQRCAMLGGMNIGREYFSEWHDLMARVEGPVVDTLSREFRRAWRKAGPWGDLALLRKPAVFRHPRPGTGGIPLRVLRTDPAEGRYEILKASLLAISGARKRVWIENPYFANDDIAVAVEAAARRGVDVRVIIPAGGDSPIMDAGNLATANGLIRAGAKVFQYPKMTHAKAMICDDWASFGSANFDTMSLRINRELNLAFSHRDAVQDLARQLFEPDFQQSKRLQLSETQAITNGLAETLADQL
jgi:cardiolipin synthase